MKSQLFLILLTALVYPTSPQKTNPQKPETEEKWTFKDYLDKFNPIKVWEKIHKKKYDKKFIQEMTIEDIREFTRSLDPLDELLRLNIENVKPKSRRAFYPDGDVNPKDKFDPFNVKLRLHELMKLTIAQVREKMVLMQNMQGKFKGSSLYMMGFLMSKADSLVRTFGRVGYMAFKFCQNYFSSKEDQFLHPIIDAEERLLNYWVEAELMIEILRMNDKTWNKMVETHFIKQESERLKNETINIANGTNASNVTKNPDSESEEEQVLAFHEKDTQWFKFPFPMQHYVDIEKKDID